MGTVSNIGFPSVFTASLHTDVLSKQRKKKSAFAFMVPNNPARLKNQIYCKLPDSGIEENHTSRRASNSNNRMEEYNIAMRRMMRNPYEYHHDLGQFHLCPIYFPT